MHAEAVQARMTLAGSREEYVTRNQETTREKTRKNRRDAPTGLVRAEPFPPPPRTNLRNTRGIDRAAGAAEGAVGLEARLSRDGGRRRRR